jgi:hypothetical protein
MFCGALKSDCDLLDAELASLRSRLAAAEAADIQTIEERDAAEDALQETHIALGGDGEWTTKIPPEAPPNSGDLLLDVPALATELRAERDRLREALDRAMTLRYYVNNPSAWGAFDQRVSDAIERRLRPAPEPEKPKEAGRV